MKSVYVKQGDTLYRIAVKEFGDLMAYKEIAKQNNISTIDIDMPLEVGRKLVLPEGIPNEVNKKRYKWWKENAHLI